MKSFAKILCNFIISNIFMLYNAYMSYSVISIPYLNPFFTYCVFMYFYLQFTHINLTITAYRNDCPIFFANLNIY